MIMEDKLKNVEVSLKGNVYFDGRVTSRTFYKEAGERFTLGIITPGSYTFDVGDKEIVTLLQGIAQICLPGESEFHEVREGETFIIPADCNYQIRTYGIVEYMCDYVVES